MDNPVDSDKKSEKTSTRLSNSIVSNKIVFIVCLIVVIALIADASLTRISDLLSPALSRKTGTTMAVFTLISIPYFVAQFMILLFVRHRSKKIQLSGNLHFYRTYKVTMAVQIALSMILLFVILQLAMMSSYFILTLVATITTSYALATGMMVLLMKSFLSWFKTSKNLVILAYGISAVMLAIHFSFTIFFTSAVLLDLPAEVRTSISRPPFLAPGSVTFILSTVHNLTSILSFSILWGATVLLLHHYSQKVGKVKYWIVVSLPLVYFLSQFPALFLKLFDPIINENPIFFGSLFTLIFTLSKPAGGILFGIAFWTIARHIRRTLAVRDYLIISALGFVLLFSSEQAVVLIIAPYPPFGLAAISFVGLSSYLIFVGIYYSAISLSQDDRVRREIKKFAVQESKLLDSIGSAQLEKDISEKVSIIKQIQESTTQSSGVQPSIDEDDIRKYLENVLQVKKATKKEDKES